MKRVPLVACLLLASPETGCKVLLYPVARAFGGPTEAELRGCRSAFDRMKAQRGTARWVVFPPLELGANRPLPGMQAPLLAGLRQVGVAQVAPSDLRPGLPSEPMGSNQMRFTWKRARDHAQWVRSLSPEGDVFVFTDVLRSRNGVIRGLMFYVVERSGEIAFVSLWNSHHFKDGLPPKEDQAACDLILERFQQALTWDANRMFPPYGVG